MSSRTDFLPAERLPRKEVQEQAERVGKNAVLTAMLDASPGMVALLNPERQIVFCNDAFAKAGGLTCREDGMGMRPGELLCCIHATEGPAGCGTGESCRHCGLAQTLIAGLQGRSASGECLPQWHNHDGNTSLEYAVEVRPMPEVGAGWQCFSLRDASGEKRRQALERIFFHDIMNRASAVATIASALAGGELSSEDSASFIEMLSVSARALVEEIRSQLTLLAAEKGELAVKTAACDSLQALRDAVTGCQPFGIPEDKHVAVLPNAQPVIFQTDGTILGRVLINLLKNALEASGAGSTVTTTCTVPSADRIRFSIHNDAVMPDNVRAHVFQRSFTTKGPGRGLGTHSVKLLTEGYLGGRAWFDSIGGQGTTFHVEFAI